MNKTIAERLLSLRKQLEKEGLQACIIPTSDPHQSEYTADYWKFREYLSGFTGSAGVLVISTNNAGLWTDSRYFLQAEEELKGSNIELFKQGIPGTPSPEEWIIGQEYKNVGIDGTVFSTKEVFSFREAFDQKGIKLNTQFEPCHEVWTDRPVFPAGKIYHFPDRFSGETAVNKIKRLRTEILKAGAKCMPISALDEIAWLLNLRGEDVDYNPVGICYAFIDQKNSILFADSSKLKSETLAYLIENGIKVKAYEGLPSFLRNLHQTKIFLDKAKTNYKLFQNIPSDCSVIEGDSPISLMKAIKNPVEIAGFRKAMIKDGIALTRFWRWLEENIHLSAKMNGRMNGPLVKNRRIQKRTGKLCL